MPAILHDVYLTQLRVDGRKHERALEWSFKNILIRCKLNIYYTASIEVIPVNIMKAT